MENPGPSVLSTPTDCRHQGPGWRSPSVACPVLSRIGLSSPGTRRTVRMDHTFFPSYRKTLLGPEEILLSIEIPYSREVRCCPRITPAPARRPESASRPTLASLNFYVEILVSELLPLTNHVLLWTMRSVRVWGTGHGQ